MKELENETLGFKIRIPGAAETAEEYDRLAGRVGACVESANSNEKDRSWNPTYKKKLVEALAKHTGVARAVTGQGPAKKDGSPGADIYEAEPKYIARILATTNPETGAPFTIADLQPIADEIAATTPMDYTEGERTTKVGKEYLEMADGVLAKGVDTAVAVAEKLQGLNPGFGTVAIDETTGLPVRESLAAIIRTNTVRKAQEDLV